MMIPALAHGSTPGRVSNGPLDDWLAGGVEGGSRPVIEVSRTVIVPFPVSGWRTK